MGHFALELKKVDKELMIVRAARAKLSAKDKKISVRGMDEVGPVQVVLSYSKYLVNIDTRLSEIIERNSNISRVSYFSSKKDQLPAYSLLRRRGQTG